MTILKKLFLMTIVALSCQAYVSASDYYAQERARKQQIFSFALHLRQYNDSNAQKAAQWLEDELLTIKQQYCYDNVEKIILILTTQLTLKEKIAYILKLKKDANKVIADNKTRDNKYIQEQQARELQEVLARKEQKQSENRWFWYNALRDTTTLAMVISLPVILFTSEAIGKEIGPRIVAALFPKK
jgi:hypothetical protein